MDKDSNFDHSLNVLIQYMKNMRKADKKMLRSFLFLLSSNFIDALTHNMNTLSL